LALTDIHRMHHQCRRSVAVVAIDSGGAASVQPYQASGRGCGRARRFVVQGIPSFLTCDPETDHHTHACEKAGEESDAEQSQDQH
jgi:hypothetical protein